MWLLLTAEAAQANTQLQIPWECFLSLFSVGTGWFWVQKPQIPAGALAALQESSPFL